MVILIDTYSDPYRTVETKPIASKRLELDAPQGVVVLELVRVFDLGGLRHEGSGFFQFQHSLVPLVKLATPDSNV